VNEPTATERMSECNNNCTALDTLTIDTKDSHFSKLKGIQFQEKNLQQIQ